MRIGLMGVAVNNGNLGCVALTYSLVHLLEKIGNKNGQCFDYTIFEFCDAPEKTDLLCQSLGLERNRVSMGQWGSVGNILQIGKHIKKNIQMIRDIQQCDIIFDITQGDSFTDVYGSNRFRSWTRIKRLVEKLGVPLVLAPQTYGPFTKKRNLKYALKIIDCADVVMSRDQISADFLQAHINKEILVATDVAFLLPYDPAKKAGYSKPKIGINVSDLLTRGKSERTDVEFTLSTDYEKLMAKVLDHLCEDGKYEIHMIPHVNCDINAINALCQNREGIIVHESFETPIEAKTCIAGMDVFIGARMHATIAAFSSRVAVIPVAYSRKFVGLYQRLGYDHVIDLQKLSTEEAFAMIVQGIESYRILQEEIERCEPLVKNELKRIEETVEALVMQIAERQISE